METTSKQVVPLQSSEGQRLLNETNIKQTLLVRIFSKQSKSGYCGVHTAALLMSARHFGLKYPDERQQEACDFRDVPFSDANMFTFDETTRVVSSEKLVVEGASLSDLEELFRQHGLFDHFERSYADSCGVDNFRSRAVVALSHSDSRQGVLVNFKCDFIVNNKLFSSGHVSPLAAYHEPSDRFLLLDTAIPNRDVWIPTEELHRRMNTRDPISGISRGFLIAS
ncbi:uncharacterized protein [Diadema antillarum]|uniref:uncharacterized protein n=1 Tax=Diadema antillarum TaxID=105358 RepID=UPI003A86BBB4